MADGQVTSGAGGENMVARVFLVEEMFLIRKTLVLMSAGRNKHNT